MKLAFGWFGTVTLLAVASPLVGQAPGSAAVVELTAEEDHRRMMDLLGITELRQGADNRNPTASNYANYDESIANPYPHLPEPLLTNDRRRVTTPEMWWNLRRPEIVEFFDREVYGRAPAVTPAVRWEVVSVRDTTLYGVPARAKQLRGRVDNSAYPAIEVEIQALLATPSSAVSEVPVIIQFGGVNFDGPGGGFAPTGGGGGAAPAGPPWQQQLLEKGWGFAILAPGSIQADNAAGLTRGIIGLVNRGQPRSLEDWGALRAWAWGASRLVDFFESDDDVDAARVGISGHSRYGKAAMVTMAYDTRFAIGYISSSGQGGVKLHRRNYGELIENVATTYYYWMAGNYIKYAGPFT
jgi:hypothetical protein